ncbi:MAG: lytic murein transglycosylase, partial [Deltaproteobacteria bacterium]|nr:lytic murein transglycosylase [Deltaproteobacteria bacterium]
PEFMAQKAIELYGRYGKATRNVSDEERVKFAPPDYSRLAGGMTVATGRRVMNANRAFFESLYKRFGVPAPFIVAVMMVETGLGAEVGKQSALLALGSMAVANDLDLVLPVISGMDPDKENLRELVQARSDWAYDELKALLHYAKASGKDAATIPGSVFGAIGICQFMPSNIPLYAVSTNKKRPTPDLFTLADAAASVASYLSAHGWKKAQTPSAQIAVLRSYNHSDVYASTVYGVATALISPTTHQGAEAARKGGNAVTAARETARASIPSGSKKVKPLETLPNYSDLLTIGNEKR